MRSCRIVGWIVLALCVGAWLPAAEPAKTAAPEKSKTAATADASAKPAAKSAAEAASKSAAKPGARAARAAGADDEDDAPKKPAAKPASGASAKKAAAKSDDDDAPAKKPSATKSSAKSDDEDAPKKAAPARRGPPPKGSQTKPDDNLCYQCHTNKDQWDETDPEAIRRYIPEAKLKTDVHFKAGVTCADCHGGDFTTEKKTAAHVKEDGFRSNKSPDDVEKSCAACHAKQALELRKGRHVEIGSKAGGIHAGATGCLSCHGKSFHAMPPKTEHESPVFIDNQVKTCGGCHEKEFAEYKDSVHGQGLFKMGLVKTAACADCHGAHGVYHAADERSTLHDAHVADTCGKCHRFIEEKLLKSVHGRGAGPGKDAAREAPGGTVRRKPTCTSCHVRHDLVDPQSAEFRKHLPDRCGNCHNDLARRFGKSTHGQLTELGYSPAAKCADCHGAHDILPLSDPKSSLAPDNRVATCAKCHPNAVANFADYDPHADPANPERSKFLYTAQHAMEWLLFSVFGFFGLHAILWFIRSLVHTLRHGRPKRIVADVPALVRFEPIHRTLHVIVIVSFLVLALTGLPLKYSDQDWAKALCRAMGGFDSTKVWHHLAAVATVFYFVTHLVWMIRRIFERREAGTAWSTLLFGPDSPVPNLRDIRDFFHMIRWFLGLGPKPTFERWTYWEKFDYWAVFWGVAIIGTSGLILWFPNFFTHFLPGEVLNLAKVIHSEEALLATGFVFAIHFFNTHLRSEKFPMDMAVLTGMVSDDEMKDERGDWIERLRSEGRLDTLRTAGPTRRHLWLVWIGGFIALAIGLSLLVGMILAGLSKA